MICLWCILICVFRCTIVQSKEIYWVKEKLAEVLYSTRGSCTKPSTSNKQISTKSDRSTTAAFSSVLTTNSTKSETPASASTTVSATSDTISDSASTTDSRTENKTDNNRTGVLLTSSPSSSFYLFHNSSNTQAISSLSIVGGRAPINSKRSKRPCRSSAENIRAHELLIITCFFLLYIKCQIIWSRQNNLVPTKLFFLHYFYLERYFWVVCEHGIDKLLKEYRLYHCGHLSFNPAARFAFCLYFIFFCFFVCSFFWEPRQN